MQSQLDRNYEEIFNRYAKITNSLAKESLQAYLFERKRKFLFELNHYMKKYSVNSPFELESKIKEQKISDHPAWEDLIDMENLIADLEQLENDIRKLS